MRIFSEKTGKEYKTVKECQKAENDFDEKVKIEEDKKAKLAENRKVRAKEVEDAYNKYHELVLKYYEDYHEGKISLHFSDFLPIFSNWFY